MTEVAVAAGKDKVRVINGSTPNLLVLGASGHVAQAFLRRLGGRRSQFGRLILLDSSQHVLKDRFLELRRLRYEFVRQRLQWPDDGSYRNLLRRYKVSVVLDLTDMDTLPVLVATDEAELQRRVCKSKRAGSTVPDERFDPRYVDSIPRWNHVRVRSGSRPADLRRLDEGWFVNWCESHRFSVLQASPANWRDRMDIQRHEIAVGRQLGLSDAEIAKRLGFVTAEQGRSLTAEAVTWAGIRAAKRYRQLASNDATQKTHLAEGSNCAGLSGCDDESLAGDGPWGSFPRS